MNTFGIPAVIATALMIYERASRNSGRTFGVLKAMDDGDVLLVGAAPGGDRLADWCKRHLRSMGKEACRVVVIAKMGDLHDGYPAETIRRAMSRVSAEDFRAKLWMDHTLIFQLHEQAMAGVMHGLGDFLGSIGQRDLTATDLRSHMRPGDVPPVMRGFIGGDF